MAVTEKHFSIGVTRKLSEKVSGSLSYVRTMNNSVESNSGSGNKIELEQNIVNLQIGYQF
jgi:long-chain fatty acid transport protein